MSRKAILFQTGDHHRISRKAILVQAWVTIVGVAIQIDPKGRRRRDKHFIVVKMLPY